MYNIFPQRNPLGIELNNVINQVDKIDIYRLLHQMTSEFTFSLSSHGIFTKIVHTLGHNHTLRNAKKWNSHNACSQDIINLLINAIKLEINNKDIQKIPKYVEIKQTILNNT